MSLVEIAQEGLSFLIKSNANHDARGRFSNGSDSDQFSSSANRRSHDRALEIASHHLDALSSVLDATATTAHAKSLDRDEKLAAHAKEIDRHVKKARAALGAADAIRADEGLSGDVEASDHDVELLEDSPSISQGIREHLDTLKSIRAELKDRVPPSAGSTDLSHEDLRKQFDDLLSR